MNAVTAPVDRAPKPPMSTWLVPRPLLTPEVLRRVRWCKHCGEPIFHNAAKARWQHWGLNMTRCPREWPAGMRWEHMDKAEPDLPTPPDAPANRAQRRGTTGARDDNLGAWLRNATQRRDR